MKAADGVRLVADHYAADAPGSPVLCLPGLTRNARDFSALAAVLSTSDKIGTRKRVIVLESRGRGRSGWADASTYTLLQELADLTAALDAWKIERAHFVGTSRGGLLTMLLAMTAPERILTAVLNDIGPRIEPLGLSRIMSRVGNIMSFASFEALAEAIEKTSAKQFTRLESADYLRLAKQFASPDKNGGVTLDYDPALAAPFKDSYSDVEPPDFWPAFEALCARPVLAIRGAHSDLLSAATVEGMRRRHCDLATYVVPGEGHAPLLWDRPSTEAVKRFINR
ncbi:MAG: alpha/beta hydrolase [Pseudomonadota bacterium]